MDYIVRELERKFLEADRFFKAVLVIGARQVGKSTMLKHLAEKQERTIVTMDDDFARELALNDPRLFFQTYKPPVLIGQAVSITLPCTHSPRAYTGLYADLCCRSKFFLFLRFDRHILFLCPGYIFRINLRKVVLHGNRNIPLGFVIC